MYAHPYTKITYYTSALQYYHTNMSNSNKVWNNIYCRFQVQVFRKC